MPSALMNGTDDRLAITRSYEILPSMQLHAPHFQTNIVLACLAVTFIKFHVYVATDVLFSVLSS